MPDASATPSEREWDALYGDEAAEKLWPLIKSHWQPKEIIEALNAKWERHVDETLDRILAELPK